MKIHMTSPMNSEQTERGAGNRKYSLGRILLIVLLLVITPLLCSAVYGQDGPYPEYGIYEPDLLPTSFYKSNRETLMKSIGDTAIAVFSAASRHTRNGDMQYRYRQNDNFFYLTGCSEPNSFLILAPGGIMLHDSAGNRRVREILFVMPRDPKAETWTGRRLGVEGARKALGIEAALTNSEFGKYLSNSLKTAQVAYVPPQPDGDEGQAKAFADTLSQAESQFRDKVDFRDPSYLLTKMRRVKSPEELVLMKTAARMSAIAHGEIMKGCMAGMYEFQLQAIFEHACRMVGAEYMAYPCICGSGENSTILHYDANRRQLRDGDVIVLDCGCEYHNYASDITRTIPAGGRFTQPQLEIYRIVLAAHDSAIAAIRAGASFYNTVTPKAAGIIQDGLLSLGIIRDRADFKKFFNHGLGHPVGLDVHDVMADDLLSPGEVWTVEPGIYIPANTPGVDPKYWNIGIRIEDEVLVTETGNEVISAFVPVDPLAIEKLMGK